MDEKQNLKKWHIFDAKDWVLGRLCSNAAVLLRGKNNTGFLPNIDNGDYVVIINAKKVKLTGKKEEQKRYYKHTGYLGNMKVKSVPKIREENPAFIIKHAVLGMLPKNKLRDSMAQRLKVYSGKDHPHVNVKFVEKE